MGCHWPGHPHHSACVERGVNEGKCEGASRHCVLELLNLSVPSAMGNSHPFSCIHAAVVLQHSVVEQQGVRNGPADRVAGAGSLEAARFGGVGGKFAGLSGGFPSSSPPCLAS